MIYCKKCILPDTRPNLIINKKDGICSSCVNSNIKKKKINWANRKLEFEKIISSYKNKKRSYDCIIPVSGGKDSTWQVITALNYKLNPLCVTWKTPSRNKIGQQNLQSLINLGVDHIDYTINPKVEKYFIKKTFKKFGSTVIPMHMAIHGIPNQLALKFNIPLIIQGENSALEYGEDNKLSKLKKINYAYLNKYGVTHNTKSSDWYDKFLNKDNMQAYDWPKSHDLKKNRISSIFLGYFFKFDPQKSFKIASKYGFTNIKRPKIGIYNFADIDDDFLIPIHHWFKWIKFGFTRSWDNLSIEIRNDRISRKEAINYIGINIEKKPEKEIDKFCKYLDISYSSFSKTIEKFRNTKIWKKEKGVWKIKNFLIKDMKW